MTADDRASQHSFCRCQVQRHERDGHPARPCRLHLLLHGALHPCSALPWAVLGPPRAQAGLGPWPRAAWLCRRSPGAGHCEGAPARLAAKMPWTLPAHAVQRRPACSWHWHCCRLALELQTHDSGPICRACLTPLLTLAGCPPPLQVSYMESRRPAKGHEGAAAKVPVVVMQQRGSRQPAAAAVDSKV